MNLDINKLKDILKRNIKWIVFFFTSIVFFAILEDVFEKDIMKIDFIAHNLVVENLRNDIFTSIFKVITNLGGVYFIITITVIMAIIFKAKSVGKSICLNLILVTALNLVIKNIVQRPRPEGYRLISESGYSFPSGHSMVSTAFYGLLIYFIYKYIKNKYLKYGLCLFLCILIPAIAFSRVYLGVHYASDVIGGFCISISYLICFTEIYKSIIKKSEK